MFKSTLPGQIQPSKNQEEVRNWLKVRQGNQSYYYNRHTKELPKLHRDQAIYAQDPVRKTWNPARVVKEGDLPRSYIVETDNSANNLSNSDQITRPSSANPQCSTLAETENSPRKSRSGRVILAPERLNL